MRSVIPNEIGTESNRVSLHRLAAGGAKQVTFYGYDDCIQLSNDRVSVVLCPAAGGRVLEYSLDGQNA